MQSGEHSQVAPILVALMGALTGALASLMPLLLYRMRQRWKQRNQSDSDQSSVRLKLIDVGESQRLDLQNRNERERQRGDDWMAKYYEAQMELAKVREAASQNNLRIEELDRRVKELEHEREHCNCGQNG